ncbi:MAG: septation protein IspZ [Sphingomonadales bacterium]|nr:septation protein IspZ [Sphingomonadales bacterium]
MTAPVDKPHPATWLNFAVDYGPVVAFFVVYRIAAPADHQQSLAEVAAVIKGTLAFMASAVAALAISLMKFRRVSPMLWMSTALILFFGGLTVFFHDGVWIQLKPTVIYLMFAVALLGGWLRRRALLKALLETAFEGLDDAGWMILSRNWGFYFLFLAALNEVLRHYFNFQNHNFGLWLQAKLYLFLPLSFLFTFAHVPMLMRHGLGTEAAGEAIASEPPTA